MRQQYQYILPPEDHEPQVYFKPAEFNTEHGPLLLNDYKLTKDQLHEQAVRLTKIRHQFLGKAALFKDDAGDQDANDNNARSLKGVARSVRSRDDEGRSVMEY